MKLRSGFACVVSAVAAVSLGTVAQAADLRWDADGPGGTAGADGGGSWDLGGNGGAGLWYDGIGNGNWVQGSNATFGDPANTANQVNNLSFLVDIQDDLVVNDIILNNAANGGVYQFDAPSFNSLTINGNVIKNGNAGPVRFDLLGGPFNLGAGDHVFALRDTPGGDQPEMAINANIHGSGGIILDNRLITSAPKESWGTLSTAGINDYTGLTQIKYGRLVISQAAGLGTTAAGTVISEAGSLSVGGPGVSGIASLTIAEPITITRNTYTGGDANDGGAFSHYGAAVISENGVGTTTFTGPFVVDSNDARVAANSSTLEIASNITVGPNATLPMLSVTGDFAGFVHLTGNNTALTGGVSIINAVELNVDNDNQIGGASAPLNFVGGGTYHPVNGYATNFGTHVLNNATFNGGIDVEAGKTFTIDQALGRALGDDTNRVGTLGKRGTGTMNINSPVNLRGGQSFWDGGIVNVNSTVELANLHLRSPIVNIGTGGSITTVAGFNSFGQDSTGTNGGPDIAVINITGNGKLIQTSGDDFNVSDNANTKGTINLSDTGTLTTTGITFVGKGNGAIGTIVQNGGTFTVNRSGNFAFVLADGRGNRTPTGNYTLNGGTFSTPGEAYVGEGGAGKGFWTQTGGTATISNWFVIGREGAEGVVDISGGTLIKNAGGNTPIGEGNNTKNNIFTVRGNGTADFQTGEVWIANGGGKATFNLQDAGTVNVNNWFVVGRGNGQGVLNISGGTLTKFAGGNFLVGSNGGSNGTINQTGGTVTHTTNETWIGDADGNGTWNLSGGTVTTALLDVGHTGVGSAVMNVSGTGALTSTTIRIGEANSVNGTFNLSGGSVTANTIFQDNSTGTKAFNFTGGRLSTGAFNVGTGLANTGTGNVAPGGLAAVGATNITGTYTQGATATTSIDLAAADSNDVVVTTGAATLGGNITLSLLGVYSPTLYTPVTVLSGSAVSGIFGTVTGIRPATNRALAVTYSPTAVLVQAAEPGDANLDHIVNFNDLVPLAQNYNKPGQSWVTGEFTGDGTVDFNDLVVLAQFYNSPATFQADWAYAQSIAPEPTTLMALGLMSVLGIRTRRR